MQGLWADGWFYLSAASLLLSGVLFFFLLSQYRAAVEAADRAEDSGEAETQMDGTSPSISNPRPPPLPVSLVSSVKDEKEITKPLTALKSETAIPADARKDSTAAHHEVAGGVNAGVLYLQNIKVQLDQLNASVSDLTKRVEAIGGRDQALIERLGEISETITQIKMDSANSKSTETGSPTKRSKKTETGDAASQALAVASPAPVTLTKPATQPADADKTIRSLDDTVHAELNTLIDNQMQERAEKNSFVSPPTGEGAISLPEAPLAETIADPEVIVLPPPTSPPTLEEEPERPRRGPVWPV